FVVDSREAIAEAYSTGRGSFRVRARWHKEETGRGTYLVVVTEIPWMVQKGRLVERIAELINDKKLPLVADMRDESAEDIRVVFEPRSRTVDAEIMMESLFTLNELIGSEAEQWKSIAGEIRKVRDAFGPDTSLGRRRSTFAEAPEHDLAVIEEALVEREPITVVVSEKGWIRALRGTVTDLSG